ncbi:MAG: DNA-3-methyladenine glycosylase 2 family protein, partial [Oscillospiraceae bacterium]|nr:DNA-3-methyladenine glycosylase 2 family protein [Oscillospiraceae bacterium]
LQQFDGDAILEKAKDKYYGIRILRQDPWETLISFIISANNNIPRIQSIIERLCENFGHPIKNGYSFPTASTLANCKLQDLDILRSGFRAKYILDAAKKVFSGEINLEEIKCFDINKSRETLMQICGVGKKISECILLFGYHKMEVFPVDVWMRRALEEYYPNGLSLQILSCPGLAQQILFYSKRNHDI